MSTPPANTNSAVSAAKDPRAIILGSLGLVIIAVIVIVAVHALPGDVAANVKNTKGENAVAIASAAFTAVATVITSYFGVKVANVAREETVKRSEQHEATVERLMGELRR